jgi:hypothetical protein
MDPLARASIALASAAEARQRALDAASYRTRIETVIAQEEEEYLILQSALQDEALALQDAIKTQAVALNTARAAKLKLLQLMRGASLVLTTMHPDWKGSSSITSLQNPSPFYSWDRIDDPALPDGISKLLDVTCAADAAAAAERRKRAIAEAEASEDEAHAERLMLYRLQVGDITSSSLNLSSPKINPSSPKRYGTQRSKLSPSIQTRSSPPRRKSPVLPEPPSEPELGDIIEDYEKLLSKIIFFVRRSPLLRSASLHNHN